MDGDMSDDERFEPERLEEVWRKMYSTVLYFASQKIRDKALEMGKCDPCIAFDLPDYRIENYMEAMNDAE